MIDHDGAAVNGKARPGGKKADTEGGKTAKADKPAYRTVAELAQAKALPEDFLRDNGLHDLPGGGIGIDYHDESGNLLFTRKRDVPGSHKRFDQPAGVPLTVYGLAWLPEQPENPIRHLTEGESDTLALRHLGYSVLGLPGSNSAKTLERKHLAGITDLYVWRDNDSGGGTCMEGVRKQLDAIGYNQRAYVVELKEAKDVCDLRAQDPARFKRRVEQLIYNADPMTLKAATARQEAAAKAGAGLATGRLVTSRLSDVQVRPVKWLVPDLIPRGKLTMIAGDGGHGKSSTTLDLIACVSTGRPAFGLEYDAPGPAQCLLISCEDDLADTVVPRLLAAGADLTRVQHVEGVEAADGTPQMFNLAHYNLLAAHLEANHDTRLVVIDPAGAYIGGKVDDHKDSELRTLLAPLAELAAKYGVSIILVKHLNKGTNIKAVARVGGSVGYVNAVRSALLVAPDPEDDTRKFLLPMKSNLSRRPTGLSYRLRDLDQGEADRLLAPLTHLSPEECQQLRGQLFRVNWLGPVSVSADDALAGPPKGKGPAKDLDNAQEWLAGYLKDCPQESKRCVDEGNAKLGLRKPLKWWRDSVLKERLCGKPQKEGFSPAKWYFTLPGHRWPRLQVRENTNPFEEEETDEESR